MISTTQLPTTKKQPRNLRAILLAFVVCVVTLSFSPAAEASTFKFVIPTTVIQTALANAVTAGATNPDLYGFFDIYVRPALPGDGVGGNDLPSYTPTSDISPIQSGNDTWTAGFGTALGDAGNTSFRFTFSVVDTVLALVTTNSNVNGKTIDGRTGERMPGADTFTMQVTSASSLLTGTIRFEVRGVAYQFNDTSVTGGGYGNKTSLWTGTFDASGTQTPEPGSLLSIGGGSLLLALMTRRRRRTQLSQTS